MKTIIQTSKAPAAVGPYSQAVEAGGFLYISGQIPIDPADGEMVTGDIRVQTDRVLKNLGAILENAGLTYAHVVKCTCLLSDMNDFKKMNEVYAQYFTGNQPARAAFEVARLPLDALIEIEAIAAR